MRLRFVVFLGAFLIFVVGINSFPLRNWDEAWYAEIIKNMASGNYSLLAPFWNGEYYFDKPPLYFWLSLPIVKIFGIGEWQIRLVSVVSATLVVFLIYLIGEKLFDKKVGAYSAIIFVSLGQLYMRFSHGNLDALLICLFLAAFYFYLLSTRGVVFSILSGLCVGLGFLTKGWALGLYPLFVIFVYALIVEKTLPRKFWLICISALLTSGWWYLLGYLKFGQPFLNWYLFTFAEGNFGHKFSLDYAQYLIRDLGVLAVFIPLHLIKVKRDIKVLTLFLVSSIFILAISLLKESLDWHILPAYPWLVLIISYSVVKLLGRVPGKLAFGITTVVLAAQIYNAYRIENIYPDRSKVGAELGVYTRNLIQAGDTVVLDDHDFTSFLFYSNAGTVYEVSQDGGKPSEWWVFKYSDFVEFERKHSKILLISRDLKHFPNLTGNIVASYKGYSFVRL